MLPRTEHGTQQHLRHGNGQQGGKEVHEKNPMQDLLKLGTGKPAWLRAQELQQSYAERAKGIRAGLPNPVMATEEIHVLPPRATVHWVP